MKTYDWIVLGGGSAGLSVVESVKQNNQTCLLVDPGPLGGVCVNAGCVPKKMMWHLVDVHLKKELSEDYGFSSSPASFSYESFLKKRRKYVSNINQWYLSKMQETTTWLKGKGELLEPHVVKVDDKTYRGNRIVVATGSRPILPDNIEGSSLGLTSDDFFNLEAIPENFVVVGSGYIAVEIASAVHHLQKIIHGKSNTTLIVRSNTLLRQMDTDLSKNISQALIDSGIHILFDTQVQKITSETSGRKKVLCTNQQTLLTDSLLWAIGRTSNLEGLNAEKNDLKLEQNRWIKTNDFFETSLNNHYALGDIINRPQLTPVAIQSGRRLVKQVLSKEKRVDFTYTPTVVFAHPLLATVGLSELEARKKHKNVECFSSSFTPMLTSLSGHSEKTFIKMVCKGKKKKVVGLHLVGEGVDEILQGFVVAMNKKATKRDFDRTIAIHPTSAEEVVTLKPIH